LTKVNKNPLNRSPLLVKKDKNDVDIGIEKSTFFVIFALDFKLKALIFMSKTIDLQVEKSSVLLKGLRNNIAELANKGITANQLNEMESDLKALKAANEECDHIREGLSAKVKAMNAILNHVKDSFADKKKVVKGYYTQEEWNRFGVMDKR
jgi:hypothetical protein